MAVDPASLVLGGASLISGITGGKSAKKSADRAANSQKQVAQAAMKVFNKIFGIAEDATAKGAFDADAQIKQLEKDTARYEGEDLSNTAGAARVAGYQPGDSVVKGMLENVKLKYRSYLDQARTLLRKSAVFDQIGAYAAASQSGALGTAGSIYGQQHQAALASMPQAGGLFSAIMPFLGNKPNLGGQQPIIFGGGSNSSNSGILPAPVAYGGR